MKQHKRHYVQRSLPMFGAGLLLLPLLLYGILLFQRPPRVTESRSLFPGITYHREARSLPRPMMIHIATVDLTAPGIGVFVTPGKPTPDRTETTARTTSEFLSEFKLQLAINANFFFPFDEKTPWDYYPHSGDRTNPLGQSISNGFAYSAADPNWTVICFAANNRAQIPDRRDCPTGTQQAVAGNATLIYMGKSRFPQQATPTDRPYARVAVAIGRTGEKLWLVAVDGKQIGYSEGIKRAELAELLMQLDVDAAIELDGGGSTTLVTATEAGPQVLNAPTHTKLPLRERPVANHLGLYAR